MAKRKVKRRAFQRGVSASPNKIILALKYMIFFGVLFGFSLGVYYASRSELWVNTSWVVSLISGVLALTFLIVYLILVFMKWFRK